ncbi:MAG: urease accessory protein UreE [Waterburya sp.]
MTEIAQTYLGNINDNSDLAELVKIESYLEVTLQESDRNKGRIHAHTLAGVAVGIIKSRDRSLQSGDLFKTDSGKLILIQLQEKEVMVLDLSSLENHISATKLVNLGHVLGNYHYPTMIHNQKIYIQLVTDKLILEKLIKDLNIPELQISYEMQSLNHNITFASHK